MILLIPEGRTARKVMDPDLKPGPPKNCREVSLQFKSYGSGYLIFIFFFLERQIYMFKYFFHWPLFVWIADFDNYWGHLFSSLKEAPFLFHHSQILFYCCGLKYWCTFVQLLFEISFRLLPLLVIKFTASLHYVIIPQTLTLLVTLLLMLLKTLLKWRTN